MAEVKRCNLISFGCERVNDKHAKDIQKTVRISVILTESTEDSFPEFNYQDELLAVKKRSSKSPPSQHANGLDPFNEDDDDVKRIAAQMEAKYGMAVSKKKKYKKDDFADIGMGYDESDSFIDNTDGYDEIVPKNVTALHGGFYINSGALEFKTDEGLSSEEPTSSDDETTEKLNGRKRILESSAASEDEASATEKSELPEKKQKLIHGLNGMQKAIKKRLFGHDKIKQIRKRRTSESKKTVRELLKDRRVDLDMTVSEFVDTPEKTTGITLSSSENKKSPDSVDNVIESVINAVVKNKVDIFEDVIMKDANRENINRDVVTNSSEHQSPENDFNDGIVAAKSPSEYVQLPENLPSDIVEIIDNMKIAAASSTEGKVKFFTGNVNVLLLNLERKCRCLGRRSRNKVYEHLAPFVKCRKETLIKRAKNLVGIEEKKRIKLLLDKLKAVVNTTMPPILKNYEEESKLVVQRKFSPDDDSNKHLRMPKRHFPWTEDTKKLLKDIITLRKKCFLNEGKQKDSIEQSLVTFLKTEVQIIWPDGWMSMNTLMKYSNLTRDKKALESLKKGSNSSSSIYPKENKLSSPSHISVNSISVNSSSGLTITPVTETVNKNSFIEDKLASVSPSETIISRISNENNNSDKPSTVLPLTSPDVVMTQTDHNNTTYNSSGDLLSRVEETQAQKLVPNDDYSRVKEQNLAPIDLQIIKDEVINENESVILENTSLNKDNHRPLIKQETPIIKQEMQSDALSNISVIDLTDQPELIRKPGPKSKTKYYLDHLNTNSKHRKESSGSNDELSGKSVLNKIITDSLNSDTDKVAQQTMDSNNSHGYSVLKNQAYDYSKQKTTNDYTKIKPVNNLPNDTPHIKLSTNELSKTKMMANDSNNKSCDLSAMKLPTSEPSKIRVSPNDYSKHKSNNDLSNMKLLTNDILKTKSSLNDYSRIKSSTNELSKSKYSVIESSRTKFTSDDHSRIKSTSNDLSNMKLLSNDTAKTKFTSNDYCTSKSLSESSKTKSVLKDYSKMKYSANDLSNAKFSANDLSKTKTSSTNDLVNMKYSSDEVSRTKVSPNDLSKSKSSHDRNRSSSISEGDDIQRVMAGLKVLEKMASPVKPRDEVKSSSAVSVINYNKGYTLDSRHSLPSSPSPTVNTPRRNNSFQDAFQKQFIPGFNMMKANLTSPVKSNYNSIPKYDPTSYKSNSTSSDRYLQNSNHIYPQQSPNKLRSVSCSSPQSANSKSSTHQK